MSISFLRQLLMKEAVKKSAGSSGIMTINKNIVKEVDNLLQKYINDALAQGVDIETLSPDQLKMIVAMNQPKPPKVLSNEEAYAFLNKVFPKKGEVVDMTGKKIDTSQGIMGGKSIKELMESGQVQQGTQGLKKSDKVKTREMFEEANKKFNEKEDFINQNKINEEIQKLEKGTDVVADSVARITSMEPVAAMKEANKVISRKGIYKNLNETQSKKILTDTEDWIFQRDPSDKWDYKKNRPFRDDPNFDPDDPSYDPDDYATGGRAGYYIGGLTEVEPNLSDIGHGSDSLMSRTRLVSPDGQATTSTGLNYLLAEDNDNIRVPFSGGTDLKRRLFLKLIAALTGGVAAVKSGIAGLGGKDVGKKAVTETIKKSAGSGQPPPYFFRLVEKIRAMGDETLATQDKAIAKKYKDYVMEEDFAGNIEIIKKSTDDMYPEDVYMKYTADDQALPNKKGFTKAEEYEEFTARPDMDGKMKDVEPGVPDEVVEEAGDTTAMTLKKADGGRIGFKDGTKYPDYSDNMFLKLVNKISPLFVDESGDFRSGLQKAKFALSEFIAGKGTDLNTGAEWWNKLDNETQNEIMMEKIKYRDQGYIGGTPLYDEEYAGRYGIGGNYADGGRIGFRGGKLAFDNATRFLRKVFGKSMDDMPTRDPELYQGLLEVVDMYRARNMEGLKAYMKKYLPHMDDAELEDFIIGSNERIEGMSGELLRLGSGRDYKAKIDMIKEAENASKLKDLDVSKLKPNAEGGLITMLGE